MALVEKLYAFHCCRLALVPRKQNDFGGIAVSILVALLAVNRRQVSIRRIWSETARIFTESPTFIWILSTTEIILPPPVAR